ncbi:MAG: cytochrome P450 [Ilumatobacteraceae bacterium]
MSPRTHEPLTEAVLTEGFFNSTLPGVLDGDPWAHLAALRAEGPLSWNEAGGYWVASHHPEVQRASTDPSRFSSAQGILTFEIGHTYASPPTMMHTDPPDHTRYRTLVAPAFRPSAMRALQPKMVAHVRRLLDAIDTASTVDIVDGLTVPFPLLVICELLGVPPEEWQKFYLWSEISVPGATEHTDEERLQLQGEMIAYLLAAVEEKKITPGDDVFSLLAAAGLSNFEIAMFAVQLLTAGNETVRNTISAGLLALADDPDQWQRLRDDRSLIPLAAEEMLRWASTVIYFMRTAVTDTELGGTELAAGDHVVLLYASANRDEAIFGPTAATFDIARSPNPHLAFGFGTHYCIGAALARLEISAVLNEMLDRYPTIEPAGHVERTKSAIIAGIHRADLVLHA